MILAPLAIQRFYDNNNNPAVSAKVFTYVAGTTTKQTTYTDSAGTPNTNPIILNYRGEANIWLDPTLTYKFVFAPKDDTDPPANPFWTVDNIPGGYGGTIDWTQIVYDQTDAEDAALVTPVNYYYAPGIVLRYYDGSGDYSTALQSAFNQSAQTNGAVADLISNSYIYGITKNITIPSNCTIESHGATIKRTTGSGVYNMLENSDTSGGNTNIKIIGGLKIDGNKDADSLVASTPADRFSGLSLITVTDSDIDVVVTGTVNAEVSMAGLYIQDSSNIEVDFEGYSNDVTACYTVNSSVKFRSGLAYNNTGSGISGNTSDDCEYNNITCHDNGYSQLSINGLRSMGNNIYCYNGASGYANVNIGHDDAGNHANGVLLTNVTSGATAGWGVTIVGSDDVTILGLHADGATNYNVRVFSNSNRSRIVGGSCQNCAISGMSYDSGLGHHIDCFHVNNNGGSGISIASGVEISTGPGVRSFDNGQTTSSNSAGILNTGGTLRVFGGKYYDDQGSPTQEAGIYSVGGSIELIYPFVPINKTYAVRLGSSPTVIYDKSRLGTDIKMGSFTCAAGATYTVTNNNSVNIGRIRFTALNAAAAGKSIYVNGISAGISFTIAPSTGTFAGTEIYAFEMA